jgi:hypothetical protein
MAPPNYKKPPQVPPTFTATPDLITQETKRQVGVFWIVSSCR